MSTHSTRILPDRSIRIPREMLETLGIGQGDAVMLWVEDGVLKVRFMRDAVRHAQALIRQYVPDSAGSVDEFIAQRRADEERKQQSARS